MTVTDNRFVLSPDHFTWHTTTTKSAETAELSEVHKPLGTHGLWGDRAAQLPAYIQNIAHALIRDGHDESSAIAIAVGRVKDWAAGGGKVTPEVRAASAKAVAEWEKLKAEHSKSKAADADVVKVGPHGYSHGWIKVGTDVDSTDLSLKKSGDVVHKPTGEVLGHVQRLENTPNKGTTTFITHHADGTKTYDNVYKREALASVAKYHNKAVRAHVGDADPTRPTEVPESLTVSPATNFSHGPKAGDWKKVLPGDDPEVIDLLGYQPAHLPKPDDVSHLPQADENKTWSRPSMYGEWSNYNSCEQTRRVADQLTGISHEVAHSGVAGKYIGGDVTVTDTKRAKFMLNALASDDAGSHRVDINSTYGVGRWPGHFQMPDQPDYTRPLTRRMAIDEKDMPGFIASLNQPHLDLSLASFSGASDAFMKNFGWGDPGPGQREVYLRVVGTPRVVQGWGVQELVTGGRFNVVQHTTNDDGAYEVWLQQEGVFDAKGNLVAT